MGFLRHETYKKKTRLTKHALDPSTGSGQAAGDAKRQCALAGRCLLEARSPDLRQAVFYALSFFWLDGFAAACPSVPRRGITQIVEYHVIP
jgi:hypothetical protein